MAGVYEKYGEASPSSPSNQNELNALDDLELDPDDNLFDESDTDIFDTGEEPQESEVFDMMVEAVAEADVFLSLGKIPEAIDVLEEARAQDPADASSRLKLMEVLFRENRKDELRELFDEIQATGDKAATEMAAIIIGPDSASEAVSSIAEDTVAAELEGLDFQRAEFEDLGLGSVDLADLELDEIDLDGVEFEGSQLEDLDLDNLTADDFDIEPAEEPQAELSAQSEEAVDIELPGTEDLDQGLIADEAPVEVSDETSSEVLANDLMDDFADFDDGNQQTAVDVKLDLAKTYLEMGDPEGAKEILEELIEDADESSDKEGVAKARALLETV
jgi:pilus assembly protein FimV